MRERLVARIERSAMRGAAASCAVVDCLARSRISLALHPGYGGRMAARPKPRRMAMRRNEKKEIAAQRPTRAPTHPGAILREDVLLAIGEAVADAARKLG